MAIKWMYNRVETSAVFNVDIEVTRGQTIVEWDGASYIPGTGMLVVHRNGILQFKDKSYTEVDGNSIEFLPHYLREGDIISILYVPDKMSLGDIRVAYSLYDLQQVSDPIQNEIAIVTSEKKFCIYNFGTWEEFIIPYNVNNIGVMFLHEKQNVTDNTERTYILNDITYNPNTNCLLIFVDGVKIEQSDYIEVDNTTITFDNDLPVGSQEIEFLVANQDSWDETHNHTIDYTYLVDGNIDTEIIKQGLTVVKSTEYTYNVDGNITSETTVKGGKTIIKTYEYNGDDISKVTVTVS